MTFSAVARCRRTGQLGVALATGLPAGGAHCAFATGLVGAVASQAFSNPYIGLDTVEGLRHGSTASVALDAALAGDPQPQRRQVIVVDAAGRTAAHTGTSAFTWRGHRCADDVAVAANMVPTASVVDAMWESLAETSEEDLWWRLAKAVGAGEAAGGETLRPCRSAVVRVVSTEEYPLLEARVDASTDPIRELLETVGQVEERGLPFTRMLPTRAEPAGRFDLEDLEARGLMPDEWDDDD